MLSQLALLASLLIYHVSAVGTPFGYASGTTGGGTAALATPTSNAQLVSWLGDNTARVIILTSIYDFTGTTVTGAACKPWTCSPNPQLAIDKGSYCENYEPNAAKATVTYDAAGLSPIYVGRNKTLLGKGSNAGIKGTGLYLRGVQNVIIQNIRITTLNPEYVWGGDAIDIDGASYIWIDHNYIDHIGRQFVATGYGAVTHTTISNNVFNGQSTYSATCNGCQYWILLLTGNGDQITLALNYFFYTSGRGPHVGGTSGYTQKLHIYNNYYVNVLGHAIDPEVGSSVLAEGNYFNVVTTPVVAGALGAAYVPTTAAQASACSSYIGRAGSSGTVSAVSTAALSALADSTVKGASVMAASAVGAYVQANAGLGIVN
ncbi:hypothetical protein FRB94_014176 [Tulasnella sp. JGI-2019a]|nr:hypothetical protein FRB94_014176 [Tulasnella sp. JGI-2019a]KAG8989821.1 hypothetical protein FRB93_003526 [Tulasnella sp. JGI-2019a]